MKPIALALTVLGLTLVALPAGAQEEGRTSFELFGHTEGSNWWTEGTGTARNPTLVVAPDSEITITARAETGFHNLKVGTNPSSDYFNVGDEPVTVTFTSPASGTFEYICEAHPVDMRGTVRVAGTPEETGGKGTPGVALVGTVLALLGVALLARRRA